MSTEREMRKGSTRTLILAVLTDNPAHGYAIAREIKRRSAGALEMGEGTLYPALRQIERDGLVGSTWDVDGVGPARRVYYLTEAGKSELARQRSFWQKFSSAVDAVLAGGAHGEPA